MKKLSGLRRRWIYNTVGVVCALGIACVLTITAVSAAYSYANLESDLQYRAETSTNWLEEKLEVPKQSFYQLCISYVQDYVNEEKITLQFVQADGKIVAASNEALSAQAAVTPEMQEAASIRDVRTYRGKDPNTGERIVAVSSPIIYSNGEVLGVLRYVTATRQIDVQIGIVALCSFAGLAFVMLGLFLISNYYIRTIVTPLVDITEKAKRVAGGTYGIQIQTKYNDEIGELADTINEMSSKINQNEMLQSEFLSSLSHELRTPLTAITGWSETLLSGRSLDTNTRRGMKIILGEAKRLTEMVVDLLDFTRIQDGKMTLNVELADIRSEFEDTVFMYQSRLTQDGIQLEYLENDDDIPEITCDPKRLRQVFLNILDNAAKHGGDGGRIEASLHFENGYVIAKIRDFGLGIPDDELPLVKKKFYKGSSKARGTGIGLAMCDEIIEMHGGKLELSNAQNGGTLVTVSLPAVQ